MSFTQNINIVVQNGVKFVCDEGEGVKCQLGQFLYSVKQKQTKTKTCLTYSPVFLFCFVLSIDKSKFGCSLFLANLFIALYPFNIFLTTAKHRGTFRFVWMGKC